MNKNEVARVWGAQLACAEFEKRGGAFEGTTDEWVQRAAEGPAWRQRAGSVVGGLGGTVAGGISGRLVGEALAAKPHLSGPVPSLIGGLLGASAGAVSGHQLGQWLDARRQRAGLAEMQRRRLLVHQLRDAGLK